MRERKLILKNSQVAFGAYVFVLDAVRSTCDVRVEVLLWYQEVSGCCSRTSAVSIAGLPGAFRHELQLAYLSWTCFLFRRELERSSVLLGRNFFFFLYSGRVGRANDLLMSCQTGFHFTSSLFFSLASTSVYYFFLHVSRPHYRTHPI